MTKYFISMLQASKRKDGLQVEVVGCLMPDEEQKVKKAFNYGSNLYFPQDDSDNGNDDSDEDEAEHDEDSDAEDLDSDGLDGYDNSEFDSEDEDDEDDDDDVGDDLDLDEADSSDNQSSSEGIQEPRSTLLERWGAPFAITTEGLQPLTMSHMPAPPTVKDGTSESFRTLPQGFKTAGELFDINHSIAEPLFPVSELTITPIAVAPCQSSGITLMGKHFSYTPTSTTSTDH